MLPLDSSLLEAVAYQEQMALLDLAFRSGAVYRYFAVPPSTYHELLRSESKGKYFNSHIRNRFVYAQMPDRPAPLE